MAPPVGSDALRQAVAEDAGAIAVLQQASFDDPWSVESVRRLLSLPADLSLVAERDGAVHGFLIGQCVIDTAEVVAIAVAAGSRRRGWGTVLLDGFEQIVAARGGTSVLLDVAADNAAAIGLYERHGYQVTARRDRYYAAGRSAPVDALVMVKALVPAVPPV